MKVRDIMTANVISVRDDTPVREVAQLLARHRISGVPVCDGDGHIVGVVSEYDLIAKPGARTASDAMSRDVISVMEDTSVDEVRFLLVRRKIKRVPVLRGTKLVGIVSRADLVREIALTWICQVCGDHERGAMPPTECPKCGVPSGFQPTVLPPVGEGAEVENRTCPTCGQELPEPDEALAR
jgi:CBS-domain-containing membrane protein